MIVIAMCLLSAADTQPAVIRKIAGTIKTGEKQKVVRVVAVDREWADVLKTSVKEVKAGKESFVYEGKVDGKNFSVEGVLPGRSYDLIVWTDKDGEKTRWEGACMDYHREILPDKEVTEEDKKWLTDFVKEMPAFTDKMRVLHMAADHKHATLLVELARTREFHSDKGGELIYRVELWYFENLFGGWAKDKNTEKVLARVRGKAEAFEKKWQFLPDLGGVVAGKAVEVTLPEQADAKNGLAGGLDQLTNGK
ncbi:MAG: hypothetical protein FWD61_11495 [Phycisphaerales bacterium]|nr:hypothetical protein [Phycisphaerales bacterium]